MAKNPFEGIENEKMDGSGSGIYFIPGTYDELVIKHVKFRSAEETFKGVDTVIFAFEVIKSQVATRPAGTVIDHVIKKKLKDGSPNPFYFKNIKKVLMPAFGTDDPADIDGDLLALVTDEKKQAAAGKRLKAIATNVTTNKGSDFTAVDFTAVTEGGTNSQVA